MKQKNGIIALLVVTVLGVGAICACILAIGVVYFYWPQPVQPAAPPATQVLQPPASTGTPTPELESAACSQTLYQDLLLSEADAAANDGQEQTLVTYAADGDSLSSPQFSDVPKDLQAYQQDLQGQKKIWNLFIHLIPFEQRKEVSYFVVFTDGVNGSLGAVEQTDNPHFWNLEMDIADSTGFGELSTTLIHEFGHLLSLNDTQVTPDQLVFDNPDDQQIFDQESAKCPNYFTFEGCSRSDAYINLFVQRFWPPLFPDWNAFQGEMDPDLYDQDAYDFYKKYADQFVSEYAATSPEEDLAESFMFFIFAPRPETSSIADQKILFFYDFPELVTLRSWIVPHLCTYSEQP